MLQAADGRQGWESYMEMAIWSGQETGIWGHEAGPHFSVSAIEALVARKKKKEYRNADPSSSLYSSFLEQ